MGAASGSFPPFWCWWSFGRASPFFESTAFSIDTTAATILGDLRWESLP